MSREVQAPDGRTWTVSRHIRWPHWRGSSNLDALDVPFVDVDFGDGILAGIVVAIAVVILAALFIVFVLPLLLLVVEGAIVVIGTLVFRRTWTIEARTIGPPPEVRGWQVRGPVGSRRAVLEVADELRRGVVAEPENMVR